MACVASGAAIAGHRPAIAARLAGSADIFARQGRRAWASVNFVTSHDGFTLTDAVSYAERHNEANGEDNRDGASANFTSNWGVEGPTDDPAINAVRDRVKRAMLATVFLPPARRCCWRATNSGARRTATTMPTARTMNCRGWTGAWRHRRRELR